MHILVISAWYLLLALMFISQAHANDDHDDHAPSQTVEMGAWVGMHSDLGFSIHPSNWQPFQNNYEAPEDRSTEVVNSPSKEDHGGVHLGWSPQIGFGAQGRYFSLYGQLGFSLLATETDSVVPILMPGGGFRLGGPASWQVDILSHFHEIWLLQVSNQFALQINERSSVGLGAMWWGLEVEDEQFGQAAGPTISAAFEFEKPFPVDLHGGLAVGPVISGASANEPTPWAVLIHLGVDFSILGQHAH